MIFVEGAGGYAGRRAFTENNGDWAILGDWCVDTLQGAVPKARTDDQDGARIGAAAHENSGALLIVCIQATKKAGTIIMDNWWRSPVIGFNQQDKDYLNLYRSRYLNPFNQITPY